MSKYFGFLSVLLALNLTICGCSRNDTPTKAQQTLRQLKSPSAQDRMQGINEAEAQFGVKK